MPNSQYELPVPAGVKTRALANSILGGWQVGEEPEGEASSTWHCPRCGTPMIVVERFTAMELRCAFLTTIRGYDLIYMRFSIVIIRLNRISKRNRL